MPYLLCNFNKFSCLRTKCSTSQGLLGGGLLFFIPFLSKGPTLPLRPSTARTRTARGTMGSPPPFFSPPVSSAVSVAAPALIAEEEDFFSAAARVVEAGAGARVEPAETVAEGAVLLPPAAVVVGVEDGVVTAFLAGEGEDPGSKTVFKPAEGAGVVFDSDLAGIFSALNLEALSASAFASLLLARQTLIVFPASDLPFICATAWAASPGEEKETRPSPLLVELLLPPSSSV
mmetsp:Transcript_38665/g.53694  ORF Transcript_38665/g.53694 Transcript_38665/m.53694 type:complete len:232 (+) Transcript_38665:187-882(+)